MASSLLGSRKNCCASSLLGSRKNCWESSLLCSLESCRASSLSAVGRAVGGNLSLTIGIDCRSGFIGLKLFQPHF